MKTIALKIFTRLLEDRKTSYADWEGHVFEKVKHIATTEKGDLTEDLLAELLVELNYENVEVLKGQRGHFDVSFTYKTKLIRVEVKLASQDTNKSFQFNGIRNDRGYTHLFCLGVTPDNIKFLFLPKYKLGKDGYTMVAMSKDTKGDRATGHKLTRKEKDLICFNNFESCIETILDEE